MSDQPLTVVLVEDDEDDYLITRDLLDEIEQGRFELRWVSSYEEALEVIHGAQADVYLVDYRLGQHNGLELLNEALSQGVRAPIIMLTGQGNREVDMQAMQAGAADYLVKGEINSFLLERTIRYAIERRQAEEALRASEERFRALVEKTADAIVLVNAEGVILYASPAYERMLGHPQAELLGRNGFDLIHPEDLSNATDELARLLQAPNASVAAGLRAQHKDGHWRWLEGTFTNLLSNPSVQAVVINLHDVTERNQAEEQIRQHAARAEALVRTAARLNATLDLQAVLNAVCEETAQALNAPATVVTLYDERRNVIEAAAAYGLPADFVARYAPVPPTLYADVLGQSGPITVNPDVETTPNLPNSELHAELNIRTAVSANMVRRGVLIGKLSVLTIGQPRAFLETELSLLKGLADQAAQAIVNARLLSDAQRRFAQVQSLRAIDMAIASSLDVRLTLNVFLEQVVTQLRVDAADVFLIETAMQRLKYAAGRGFRTRQAELAQLPIAKSYAGRAVLERRVMRIASPEEARDFPDFLAFLSSEGFVAYFNAPLIAKGQIIGVLDVFHRAALEVDDEWINFLETLAGQAAIAIENAALFNDLQRSNSELRMAYDTTLEGWSRALDLRDKETEGHTQRVTEMTLRLAQIAGMNENELIHVRRGALLHDIGKMGIPDQILLKPGPLTEEEWVIMRRHPTYAHELLLPIAFLRPALEIPYCHHEKWDGTGYPRGLKGEEIPMAARLFAVADVWDALRSDRPYRAGWPVEKVRDHIRSLSGAHFDPRAVEIFMEVVQGAV